MNDFHMKISRFTVYNTIKTNTLVNCTVYKSRVATILHERTMAASILIIGIFQITNCDNIVGFPKSGYISGYPQTHYQNHNTYTTTYICTHIHNIHY